MKDEQGILFTFLFGDYKIVSVSTGRSEHQHTFGGPHDRHGASREECDGKLIHLLHRLDLHDPIIPIRIPGIRWLPLYYCFDSRANSFGYQLINDDTMRVFFVENETHVSTVEAWPSEDYPKEFPKSNITISTYPYDPTNLEDAYNWVGVFGLNKLSEEDQVKAKKRYADLMDFLGYYPPSPSQDYFAIVAGPFMQGKPEDKCMNPSCINHHILGQLSTIAIVPDEPVKGMQMFGEYGTWTQLIYQLCGICNTITVTTECT